MDMEMIIDEFLKNEIGGVMITDSDNKVLYSDEKAKLPDNLMSRFMHRVPALHKNKERKLWELTDADIGKYYRILSIAKEYDGKLYKCHCLTDVSELADLSKDISEYSRRISDFSDFQTEILKVISKPYDSFLPALAHLCKSEEAIIHIERLWSRRIAVTTFTDKSEQTLYPIVPEREEIFSLKRFSEKDGYKCFMSEPVAERRCTILLKSSPQFNEGFFKDIGVYNVIRLYVENGVLREKIIYESEHDTLTSMYNASVFSKMRANGFGHPESLAIYISGVGDLEYMNDHFGNNAGDILIKRAADCILPDIDDNVLGFRIGGDKFAVVAQNTDEEKANTFIKVWKERLDELNSRDERFKCTISCGMAFGKDGYDTEKLIEQADVGMYREKRRLKEELIKRAAVT